MEFCEWWNFNNFDMADFKKDNGISLAQKGYEAYTELLKKTGDKPKIEAFVKRLDLLIQNHPRLEFAQQCKNSLK